LGPRADGSGTLYLVMLQLDTANSDMALGLPFK
jgi:hypothetical protein